MSLLLGALLAASVSAPPPVRGMTVSCQTWGYEWGTDGFAEELDRLKALGVNWVAIHPYARIGGDGTVSWRPLQPDSTSEWLRRPIREAHARGMEIMIKPHLAYWGSPFSWRGEIQFPSPAGLQRFFTTYTQWLTELAKVAHDADAFVVGTELDKLVGEEARWRAVVAAIRGQTRAHLTYAANWTDYRKVAFWDALDAVGVQAYFPLSDHPAPNPGVLRTRWTEILADLRTLHQQTGKPVIFTELGYDARDSAAREPWKGRSGHHAPTDDDRALQKTLLEVALSVIHDNRSWLRGAFLWKWFVGPAPGENFELDHPGLRRLLKHTWG